MESAHATPPPKLPRPAAWQVSAVPDSALATLEELTEEAIRFALCCCESGAAWRPRRWWRGATFAEQEIELASRQEGVHPRACGEGVN